VIIHPPRSPPRRAVKSWRTHGNNARTGTAENSGSPVPNATGAADPAAVGTPAVRCTAQGQANEEEAAAANVLEGQPTRNRSRREARRGRPVAQLPERIDAPAKCTSAASSAHVEASKAPPTAISAKWSAVDTAVGVNRRCVYRRRVGPMPQQ